MPSYTWLDESIEHSDYDAAKCAAIAKRISAMQHEDEQQSFRAAADYEDGRYYGTDNEDCECDYCLKADHRCDKDGPGGECTMCAIQTDSTECETLAAYALIEAARRAERDLEYEWLDSQLNALGARLMRPYEHWNEDERYMEYMER